ncbi:cytochrome c3 family protein [Neorhodopirellula pilleata]|uniref:Cytochrome c-552/4 domain-containing protein n=1 Tax=Neorhodopirellula pilleata TaxID=2714738 RepID=A0A5C5ZZA3_9BACT|nr:cytochrome c3 family protein [Neorhodopirellula pilleata]TWT92619.1 hypothetical protein Pla100_46390 [Neorhodopirellula pilleata]
MGYSLPTLRSVAIVVAFLVLTASRGHAADGSRQFARSDSDKRYLHHIDLYDNDNRKITSESTRPYSPENTCGRCHDYETISHGWHFNAFRNHTLRTASSNDGNGPAIDDGRPGEPWIWTDERTGTQLPLSYRDWPGVFNPADVGIDDWAMTRYFGGRIPGGQTKPDQINDPNPRWQLSGELEVDCMACHAVSGAYDFEQRRDAIESENFAWAPTAALRLGEINGTVGRIKEGSDPSDEAVQAKLPTVAYDPRKFNPDGTMFIDLVRHVENNACYQCHSQRTVSLGDSGHDADSQAAELGHSGATAGINERWIHDQDVHLRAGMKCTDCHRNGIDHHISRGFEGERHPAGESVVTLSCVGCHLGTDFYLDEDAAEASVALKNIANRPGRLGSPLPLHEGLPPIHFEKMACTTCHSGPIPTDVAGGIMTSLSHGLGSKTHRTGEELPLIRGPVFAPSADHLSAKQVSADSESSGPSSTLSTPSPRVRATRVVWPAFWGFIEEGNVRPLPPDEVYAATRKALRVRRGFVEEISLPTLQDENKSSLFNEKVYAALAAIEDELKVSDAVYVSTGNVFAKSDKENELKTTSVDNQDMVGMVQWPIAHNVRPAGWSLGATGCIECHADDGKIFASTVAAVGPAPIRPTAVTMASLQRLSDDERQVWNQMFLGRTQFKVLTMISLAALAILMLAGAGAKIFAIMVRPAMPPEAKTADQGDRS